MMRVAIRGQGSNRNGIVTILNHMMGASAPFFILIYTSLNDRYWLIANPHKVYFLYLDQGSLLIRNNASQKGTAPIIQIPDRIPLTPSADIL